MQRSCGSATPAAPSLGRECSGTQLVECRQLPVAASCAEVWGGSVQFSGALLLPDETKCRPVQPSSWSASEQVVTCSSVVFVPGNRADQPGNSRNPLVLAVSDNPLLLPLLPLPRLSRVTTAGAPSGSNLTPACEPPRLGVAPRQAGCVHSPEKQTKFAAVPRRPGFTCQIVLVPLQKSSTAPEDVSRRRSRLPSVPPAEVRQISGRPIGCHWFVDCK